MSNAKDPIRATISCPVELKAYDNYQTICDHMIAMAKAGVLMVDLLAASHALGLGDDLVVEALDNLMDGGAISNDGPFRVWYSGHA